MFLISHVEGLRRIRTWQWYEWPHCMDSRL